MPSPCSLLISWDPPPLFPQFPNLRASSQLGGTVTMIKLMPLVTDEAAETPRRVRSCPESHSKPTADPGSEPGSLPPGPAPPRSSRWYAGGSCLSVPRVCTFQCSPDASLMLWRGLDMTGWLPRAGHDVISHSCTPGFLYLRDGNDADDPPARRTRGPL